MLYGIDVGEEETWKVAEAGKLTELLCMCCY